MSYYDKKGGRLHFSVEIKTIVNVNRGLGNEIIIEFNNEEKYKLKPSNDKEVKEWLSAIRKVVEGDSQPKTSNDNITFVDKHKTDGKSIYAAFNV